MAGSAPKGLLFHATSFAALDGIERDGLVPRAGGGLFSHGSYGEHSQEKVFLAHGEQAALAWFGKVEDMLAHHHGDDEEPDTQVPVLLRVEVPRTLAIQLDPIGNADVPGSYFVTGTIPPERIEFWSPTKRAWTMIGGWCEESSYDGVKRIEHYDDEGDVVGEDDGWSSRGFTVFGPYDRGGFKPPYGDKAAWWTGSEGEKLRGAPTLEQLYERGERLRKKRKGKSTQPEYSDREWLIIQYAHGACHVLSLVLHDLTGGQVWIMTAKNDVGEREVVHSAIHLPGMADDVLLDAYGVHSREEIIGHYMIRGETVRWKKVNRAEIAEHAGEDEAARDKVTPFARELLTEAGYDADAARCEAGRPNPRCGCSHPGSGDRMRVRGAPQRVSRGRAIAHAYDFGFSSQALDWEAFQRQARAQAIRAGLPLGGAIGKGSFAAIYPIQNRPEWVLKITGDPSDAVALSVISDALAPPPGLPRVLLVFAFPGGRLFGAVVERLTPLPRGEDTDVTLALHGSVRGGVRGERLVEGLDWLRERGIVCHDAYGDNVMVNREGQWVPSDLGASEAPEVSIPELEHVDLTALWEDDARLSVRDGAKKVKRGIRVAKGGLRVAEDVTVAAIPILVPALAPISPALPGIVRLRRRAEDAVEGVGDRVLGLEEARMRTAPQPAPPGALFFSVEAMREAQQEAAGRSRTVLVELDPQDFLAAAKKGTDDWKAEGVEGVLSKGKLFESVPQLHVVTHANGVAEVIGHDGRHRARALLARGVRRMPVRVRCIEHAGDPIRWSDPAARWPTTLISEDPSRVRVPFPPRPS